MMCNNVNERIAWKRGSTEGTGSMVPQPRRSGGRVYGQPGRPEVCGRCPCFLIYKLRRPRHPSQRCRPPFPRGPWPGRQPSGERARGPSRFTRLFGAVPRPQVLHTCLVMPGSGCVSEIQPRPTSQLISTAITAIMKADRNPTNTSTPSMARKR